MYTSCKKIFWPSKKYILGIFIIPIFVTTYYIFKSAYESNWAVSVFFLLLLIAILSLQVFVRKSQSFFIVIEGGNLRSRLYSLEESRKKHLYSIIKRDKYRFEVFYDDGIPFVIDLSCFNKMERKYIQEFIIKNYGEYIREELTAR